MQYRTWGLKRILQTLDERHATVVISGDDVSLKGSDPKFPVTRETVADILPHLRERRSEVIDHFRAIERAARDAVDPPQITRESVTHPFDKLTPGEKRHELFRVMTLVARGTAGRVAWYSRFTRLTGYLDERDTSFPPDATSAAVAYTEPWQDPLDVFAPLVTELTEWHALPNAFPPKGWKPPDREKPRRKWNPWAHVPNDADGAIPD